MERLFFTASFLLLVLNFGKLFEIEPNCIYLNLDIVKEQVFILLVLCHYIGKMEETRDRKEVLAGLKVLLFLFSAGALAKTRN